MQHTHTKRETKDKTKEERLEAFAYTLNHSIVCTATDWIDIPMSRYIQNDLAHQAPNALKPFLKNFHIGCGHHHHDVSGWHLSAAEVIGDFGSVPVVMGIKRIAPGLMTGIEHATEPLVGTTFHKSAEMWAKAWARRKGVAYDSEEYQQRVDEIYHHEMEHLPQAILWTLSSIGLNAAAQRTIGHFNGNQNPWSKILFAKSVGSTITSGLVIGTRAAFPTQVRWIDKGTSNYILTPVFRVAAKSFGIGEETIEKVIEEQRDRQDITWSMRLKEKEAEAGLSSGDMLTAASRGMG